MAGFLTLSRRAAAAAIFTLCVLIQTDTAGYAQQEKDLTLEEISQTTAAKYFIAKRYQEALQEFQKLEEQHPRSTLIKRYIASIHDSFRQWDKAEAKLNEVIILHPEATVARLMLGKVYIQKAELDKASEQFEYVAAKSEGSAPGRTARTRLAEIQKLKSMSTAENEKKMPAEAFMTSSAAQAFSQGKYQEALAGFDALIQSYPDDILLRRFQAIALQRLGRKEEAFAAFEQALDMEPANAATRYYYGEALMNAGKLKEAREEFRRVIENEENIYEGRAKRSLFRTLRTPAAVKPWSVSASAGYEYDTNAVFQSRDGSVATPGDSNSGRYTTTVFGTYRFYQKEKLSLTADALYAQVLYDEFPHLQTYTPGAGVSALYITSFFGKPAFVNVREGVTAAFLKNKIFVFSNTVSGSYIVVPTPNLRTLATYRWTLSEFDNAGTQPSLTDRDGQTHGVTLSATYYLNEAKSLYFSSFYDFEYVFAQGLNNIRYVHGARAVLHAPLFEKVEGEVQFRLRNSDYPKTVLPLQRNDTLMSLTAELSRPLSDRFILKFFYTYEDTTARNNIYEYRKHVTGTELSYQY